MNPNQTQHSLSSSLLQLSSEPVGPLVDIGVNLLNSRFDSDRLTIIQDALDHQVYAQILTGCSLKESQNALEFCSEHHAQFPYLWATAGIHPHDSAQLQDTPNWTDALKKRAQHPKCVAIGECGLDFNRDFSPRPIQESVFETQLQCAIELNLPVFLHERDAHDRFYAIVKNAMIDLKGAVVHCFTGNRTQIEAYLDLGCMIGITGWICDERRGHELQDAVQSLPLDRVMVETDSPYLTPRGLKPKPKRGRNVPSTLPYIVSTLAHYMNVSSLELTQASYANSLRFFNLVSLQENDSKETN